MARIPVAEQVAQADALGVHHNETLAIGERAEAAFSFEPACGAERPVKRNHHGKRCRAVVSRGHVHVVAAPDAAHPLIDQHLVSPRA